MKYLIVEDHLLYAELIAVAINAKDVRVAQTMREAFDMIEASPPNFIVLDLSLPDSTAEMTMKKIRELKSKAHGATVVVITGDDNERTKMQAMSEGADSYFVKGGNDEFFGVLAAKLRSAREEPCASRSTIEQIERTVCSITGTRFDPPRLTWRVLASVLPLLRPI